MGASVDLIGKRFGRLVVLWPTKQRKYCDIVWECFCDCGKIFYTTSNNLMWGGTCSCGCLNIESSIANRAKAVKHNYSKERLYAVWSAMKSRCYNPNTARYHDYGGRGIRICDEWRDDYAAFRDWAMSAGYDPDAPRGQCTIDRIDVNGNYEPSNCRWADMKTQRQNQRKKKR